MKIAMISGVTGQVGSYMAELLLKNNYFVVGLKRRTSLICTDRINHIFNNKNFKLEYFDLDDMYSIVFMLQKYKPEVFVNFAAQSHVKVSFDVPQDTTNSVALGPLKILDAIKLVSPNTKFFQMSSSEMFGENKEVPFNEDSKFIPISSYACSKLFAHNIVNVYRKSYNIWAASGIIFNTESPRRGETFITRKITLGAASIKLGLKNKLVLGNIDAKRDWTYAGDVVEAIYLILSQKDPEDYVICSGKDYSIKDFLEYTFRYAKLGDYKKYVEIDKKYFRPLDVHRLLGDYSKIKKNLGWEPKISLEKLIEKMYDSDIEFLKNEKRISW